MGDGGDRADHAEGRVRSRPAMIAAKDLAAEELHAGARSPVFELRSCGPGPSSSLHLHRAQLHTLVDGDAADDTNVRRRSSGSSWKAARGFPGRGHRLVRIGEQPGSHRSFFVDGRKEAALAPKAVDTSWTTLRITASFSCMAQLLSSALPAGNAIADRQCKTDNGQVTPLSSLRVAALAGVYATVFDAPYRRCR